MKLSWWSPVLAAGSLLSSSTTCRAASMQDHMQSHLNGQIERMRSFLGPDDFQATIAASNGSAPATSNSTITFSNPKAAEFYVNGTMIPDVTWDAGPSWAGLMPISGDPNETRKLFFWFWPTTNASNGDELLFWTNGGPGCSSLEGFLQENGPISWTWGQSAPVPNQWSWTQLSHVLWVEQPVGTGFSQGTPNITNDDELAAQVYGFLEQFLEVFSELGGKNFFLSGESYAGFYVPYIANYIYEHPGLNLSLKGISIADPTLSSDVVQSEIPALRFVQNNFNLFHLDSATMAQLQNISDTCGYTDYLDKYLTYPPAGPLPLPVGTDTRDCFIQDQIVEAVSQKNPVFDIYRVSDQWPSPWSVLGFPQSTQEFIYFNRTDVQDAIHAPHIEWSICSNINVYVGPDGDTSEPVFLNVLPNVIEKSERTVILHGLADYILIAEGTRITIQNMTWNGMQGFQTPIQNESFALDGYGIYGNTHTERNLTYVEFYFSGHMTPQFVPWAAFSTASYLLGRQPEPGTA